MKLALIKTHNLTKLRLKRLDELIEIFAEEIKPNQFNIACWLAGTLADEIGAKHRAWIFGTPGAEITVSKKEVHTCGTTACVAGWAAVTNTWKKSSPQNFFRLVPHYRGATGSHAFAMWLGIDSELAHGICELPDDEYDNEPRDIWRHDETPTRGLVLKLLKVIRAEALNQQHATNTLSTKYWGEL